MLWKVYVVLVMQGEITWEEQRIEPRRNKSVKEKMGWIASQKANKYLRLALQRVKTQLY